MYISSNTLIICMVTLSFTVSIDVWTTLIHLFNNYLIYKFSKTWNCWCSPKLCSFVFFVAAITWAQAQLCDAQTWGPLTNSVYALALVLLVCALILFFGLQFLVLGVAVLLGDSAILWFWFLVNHFHLLLASTKLAVM